MINEFLLLIESSTIRLVGGRTSLEGRVEILLDGRWGTICANQNWNAAAAATVCRQLGLSTNGKNSITITFLNVK